MSNVAQGVSQGKMMIMTSKNGLLSNSNSHFENLKMGAHSNGSLASQIPPSHLNLMSPQNLNLRNTNKGCELNQAGSTPGINFQISTMNEED